MLRDRDEQTIVAHCTPSGAGAIGVLRISGVDAVTIADKICSLASRKKLADLPTHTIHFGSVIDHDGTTVDQVLFMLMRGPRTFTGQDTVEINCHNNPFIIERILQCTLAHGARIADKGEFTRRSVLNKKIDLVQAEAINDLVHANTQLSLKKSLAQLEGSLSHELAHIEKQLVNALALSEASFEFIDEDIGFGPQIHTIITQIRSSITQLKVNFDQQQQIRQGIRIALIGSVNAGKSSLFNALLNKDRAIVTNIAGTTRDVIEAGLYKSGNYWTLIDTAGLRQSDDIIEQAGIRRSLSEAELADIILLIFDGARDMTKQEHTIYTDIMLHHPNKVIVIRNKADLVQNTTIQLNAPNSIATSSINKHNIDRVEQQIQSKIAHLFSSIESPFLLNKRQYTILLELDRKLESLNNMLIGTIEYELISYHLNDTLAHISELTGKSVSEQAMDAVFREFCVGK